MYIVFNQVEVVMSYFDFDIKDSEIGYSETIEKKKHRGAKMKYPFDILGINQYFDMPSDVKPHSMRCLASRYGKNYNKVFFVDIEAKRVVRLK